MGKMWVLSVDLSTCPARCPVSQHLSPVCLLPDRATCSALAMRNRALDGCTAISRQTVKAGLPFPEIRYGGPLPSPGKQTPQRKFLSWTVVIYCVSQAMGKLGTSLSSGYVMLNRTRTQVLLVGAPTQGRSPAMKRHCFMNSCATP